MPSFVTNPDDICDAYGSCFSHTRLFCTMELSPANGGTLPPCWRGLGQLWKYQLLPTFGQIFPTKLSFPTHIDLSKYRPVVIKTALNNTGLFHNIARCQDEWFARSKPHNRFETKQQTFQNRFTRLPASALFSCLVSPPFLRQGVVSPSQKTHTLHLAQLATGRQTLFQLIRFMHTLVELQTRYCIFVEKRICFVLKKGIALPLVGLQSCKAPVTAAC